MGCGHFQMPGRWRRGVLEPQREPVTKEGRGLHHWGVFRWGVGAGVDVPSDTFSTCSGSGLRWTNRPGGQLIWLAGKGNRHDMCWVGRVFYYASRAALAGTARQGHLGQERESWRGRGEAAAGWEYPLVD